MLDRCRPPPLGGGFFLSPHSIFSPSGFAPEGLFCRFDFPVAGWLRDYQNNKHKPREEKTMTKIIDSPCAAPCARGVCSGHTHTGISNNTCLSDHARGCASARRRPFTDAEVAAWRERVFGETL